MEHARPVERDPNQYLDEKKTYEGSGESAQDGVDRRTSLVTKDGVEVNASGHRDQLQRQYGLLSICGLALTIDNAWVALGGSLTVSIRELALFDVHQGCTLTRSISKWWPTWRSLRVFDCLLLLFLRRGKHS